jgi:hypothetical protein
MSNTETTETTSDRVWRLLRVLGTIYQDEGVTGLFAKATRTAIEMGIDDRREIAYAVYEIGKHENDDYTMASAISSYANAALRHDEHWPDHIAAQERAAYIGARTLLDFQRFDDAGGFLTGSLQDPRFVTFSGGAASTVYFSEEVQDDDDD